MKNQKHVKLFEEFINESTNNVEAHINNGKSPYVIGTYDDYGCVFDGNGEDFLLKPLEIKPEIINMFMYKPGEYKEKDFDQGSIDEIPGYAEGDPMCNTWIYDDGSVDVVFSPGADGTYEVSGVTKNGKDWSGDFISTWIDGKKYITNGKDFKYVVPSSLRDGYQTRNDQPSASSGGKISFDMLTKETQKEVKRFLNDKHKEFSK